LVFFVSELAFVLFAAQTPAIAQQAIADPVKSPAPIYPARCLNRAEEIEFVTLRFDVSAAGATENITVIDSTNNCFEKVAVKSIEDWRYHPDTAAGTGAPRKGFEKTITFQKD
jgi:protein TonB